MLYVKDLSVTFPTTGGQLLHATDDVSFTLMPGEILGIVGESGSGKSVTAAAIMGLVPKPGSITGGSVHLRDEDLLKADPGRLRQLRGNEISIVFQNPMTSLNPTLTVGWQLREGVRAHRRVSRRVANDMAADALAAVDIPEPRKRLAQYPHEFSGGMRQRVAIALALINEPKIVIADEATSSLDVTIQAQIIDLLQRLTHERDLSVIFISHDLALVSNFCDRVAVMYAGQVVESGTAATVLESPAHPYTSGLLASIPPEEQIRRLETIPPGIVPNVDPDPACRFLSRCGYAHDHCHTPPAMVAVSGDHTARCCLPKDEPARRVTTQAGKGTG